MRSLFNDLTKSLSPLTADKTQDLVTKVSTEIDSIRADNADVMRLYYILKPGNRTFPEFTVSLQARLDILMANAKILEKKLAYQAIALHDKGKWDPKTYYKVANSGLLV